MRISIWVLSIGLITSVQAAGPRHCSEIESDVARLKCYDEAAAHKEEGKQESASAVTVNEAPVTATTTPQEQENEVNSASTPMPEQLFGKSAEEASAIIAETTGAEDVDKIRANVTKVVEDQYGRLLVVLDNEQSWRQLRADRFKVKVGDTVEVRRAVMDSYTMQKTSGGRQTKVRRVD